MNEVNPLHVIQCVPRKYDHLRLDRFSYRFPGNVRSEKYELFKTYRKAYSCAEGTEKQGINTNALRPGTNASVCADTTSPDPSAKMEPWADSDREPGSMTPEVRLWPGGVVYYATSFKNDLNSR